jgi:MerR family copper efflux transcriptional regulator
MLISQFAQATGLSPETIRFYVRKGLLKPDRTAKGGSSAYQLFGANDLTAAWMIRLQKSLGYSLREIAMLNSEYQRGANSPERTAQVLQSQIDKLQGRRQEIDAALTFLNDKLAWVEAGNPGDAPQASGYGGC